MMITLQTYLILPYSTNAPDREKPFTFEIELASILSLAEAWRGKGGLLGSPPEKISFVSKLYYPLYAVPWRENCIIIDALNPSPHVFPYMRTPDVHSFVEDVKRSSSSRELYWGILRDHSETFREFEGRAQIAMEFLIVNKTLLSQLPPYIRQGALRESLTIPLIPPRLDEKAATERAGRLISLWEQTVADIDGLEHAIDILDEATKLHKEKLRQEITYIEQKYDAEIARISPYVDRAVEKLKMEHEVQMKKATKANEKALAAALRERGKRERELQKLLKSKERCIKGRESAKRRRDKGGESFWNRALKRRKKQISEVEKKISALSEQIDSLHRLGETQTRQLSEKYQEMISRELDKINNLKTARASEIDARGREIKGLEEKTSSIMSQIGSLIDRKRLQRASLEELAVSWSPTSITLICVPFYIIRYEAEKESRYKVHPPIMAESHEGVIKKFKKAILGLESRMGLLLQPRSDELREFFSRSFLENLYGDRGLEKDVYEVGSFKNLLVASNLKDMLVRGFEELKEEDWISTEEADGVLASILSKTGV